MSESPGGPPPQRLVGRADAAAKETHGGRGDDADGDTVMTDAPNPSGAHDVATDARDAVAPAASASSSSSAAASIGSKRRARSPSAPVERDDDGAKRPQPPMLPPATIGGQTRPSDAAHEPPTEVHSPAAAPAPQHAAVALLSSGSGRPTAAAAQQSHRFDCSAPREIANGSSRQTRQPHGELSAASSSTPQAVATVLDECTASPLAPTRGAPASESTASTDPPLADAQRQPLQTAQSCGGCIDTKAKCSGKPRRAKKCKQCQRSGVECHFPEQRDDEQRAASVDRIDRQQRTDLTQMLEGPTRHAITAGQTAHLVHELFGGVMMDIDGAPLMCHAAPGRAASAPADAVSAPRLQCLLPAARSSPPSPHHAQSISTQPNLATAVPLSAMQLPHSLPTAPSPVRSILRASHRLTLSSEEDAGITSVGSSLIDLSTDAKDIAKEPVPGLSSASSCDSLRDVRASIPSHTRSTRTSHHASSRSAGTGAVVKNMDAERRHVRFDSATIHEFDMMPDPTKVPTDDHYAVGLVAKPHTTSLLRVDAYESVRATQRKGHAGIICKTRRRRIWKRESKSAAPPRDLNESAHSWHDADVLSEADLLRIRTTTPEGCACEGTCGPNSECSCADEELGCHQAICKCNPAYCGNTRWDVNEAEIKAHRDTILEKMDEYWSS